MTSVLRDIETLANDIAKDYTNLHLVVRGTPTFCDQNLRGSIRFAQRQGNFLPVIAPDNSTSLAADVVPPIDTLTLGRIPTAFTTLGAVLTIGPGRELVEVVDVDTIRSTIRTAADIVGTHAAGTQVDLYGVPVSIIGNQAQADTVIQLRSDSIVVIGEEGFVGRSAEETIMNMSRISEIGMSLVDETMLGIMLAKKPVSPAGQADGPEGIQLDLVNGTWPSGAS